MSFFSVWEEEGSGWWARVPARGVLRASATGYPRRGPLPGSAERWGPGRESKGVGLPSVWETQKGCFVGNRELWVLAGLEEGRRPAGVYPGALGQPRVLPSAPASRRPRLRRGASPQVCYPRTTRGSPPRGLSA